MNTARFRRLAVSLVIAVLAGGATLNVARFIVVAENPLISAVQVVVLFLVFPGIFGAKAISGNFHAFDLSLAATLNGLIFFVVAWSICAELGFN